METKCSAKTFKKKNFQVKKRSKVVDLSIENAPLSFVIFVCFVCYRSYHHRKKSYVLVRKGVKEEDEDN